MQQSITITNRFELKPTSKQKLAGDYNVTRGTVLRWCKKLGIDTKGCLLSVKDLLIIIEKYGAPGNYEQQMELNLG